MYALFMFKIKFRFTGMGRELRDGGFNRSHVITLGKFKPVNKILTSITFGVCEESVDPSAGLSVGGGGGWREEGRREEGAADYV
jgi:hypothetical protein